MLSRDPAPPNPQTAALVARLSEAVERLAEHHRPAGLPVVSSGSALLDRLLPGGGLPRGSLVEWLAVGHGSGATTLALLAAQAACQAGGMLAVLDGERSFYPPAIAGQIELGRLLVIRPATRRDEAWALDQLLRQGGLAATLAWPGQTDDRALRRLQLAAEAGAGLGLLVRPASVRPTACWASVRLAVQPLPTTGPSGNRLLCVKILHCRSSAIGGSSPSRGVHLEFDQRGLVHESLCIGNCQANFSAANFLAAHPLRLAEAVAAAAPRRGARRA